MSDRDAMTRAISICKVGLILGQSPFGAVITKDGVLVAEAHNTVRLDQDPTCHAEINAIRRASKSLGSYELSGCVLYSTCEPCPMCLAAAHWAGIDLVVFGASIDDAKSAGFRELSVSATTMVQLGGSPLKLERGLMLAECQSLLDEWKRSGDAVVY
jgi:guanine deaminase